MDFFDKLGKKASQTYKVTAEKTGKIAKETKMKIKIVELRSEITDIYEEIGEKIYLEHVEGKNKIELKNTIEEEYNQLDEINEKIQELQKQCLKLQDKIKCYKCNSEIEKKVNYCPNCGAIQIEEDKENENLQVEIEELEVMKKEEKKEQKKEEKKENKAKKELEKTVEIESAVDKKE